MTNMTHDEAEALVRELLCFICAALDGAQREAGHEGIHGAHGRCDRCGESFREDDERAEVYDTRDEHGQSLVIHVACMQKEDAIA